MPGPETICPRSWFRTRSWRRIGVANYIEFLNPGRDDLRAFLIEQFQTSIRKGAVPDTQRKAVEADALDEAVPDELCSVTEGEERALQTYPFESDAFDEFVSQIASGEMANKPSEAQIRVQKAAQRAMRLGETDDNERHRRRPIHRGLLRT